MADRRDFMGYIGTGAIGSIVGYYVGAQKLLGIQSEDVVVERDPDQPTEEPPEDTPTENPNTDSDILDDFEDTSQLDWQITDGERSNLTFADESARGSHSLFFEDSSNRIIIKKRLGEVNQPQFLSYWFKYQSQNDNNSRVSLHDKNDNKLIEIREYNQTVHYKNERTPGVLNNPIADINQNEWYQVELTNIDFEMETLKINVKNINGETIGSATEVSFWNSVDNVDYIRILNALEARSGQPGAADPLWIDHIIRR